MSRRWDISNLSIIFAEDDFIFREIAVPAITKAGIQEENILQAEHGEEALEKLDDLQDGNPNDPIVMLLDMRMPTMDGKTCATQVKERHASGKLKRVPYLVCCSAGVEQVTRRGEDGSDLFDLTMPKPFADKEVALVIKNAQEWWGAGDAPAALPAGGGGSWDISSLKIIVENKEPICRMALVTALAQEGPKEDMIEECDDMDEVKENLRKASNSSVPIMVVVGSCDMAPLVREEATACKLKAYIVFHSVDAEAAVADGCDDVLKKSNKECVKAMLERCQAWWTKG